tara:strand:- start:9651 stop:9848 length:198 start_codon:yes stop_codon:yes gene_type:complete
VYSGINLQLKFKSLVIGSTCKVNALAHKLITPVASNEPTIATDFQVHQITISLKFEYIFHANEDE